MDTDQLRTFERIVREGSFGRAGRALGVSQPTVSARIRALEAALGGDLFARGARPLALTDLGAAFLPYARRALDVLDAGADAAREVRAGRRGRVTIGVLESLSGGFLGPVLARFHAANPDVEILVRAGRHEQIAELLDDGVVGLAILAWPAHDPVALRAERLLTLREPVVLAAAPTHALARGAPADAGAVAAEARPFLLLRWWVTLPTAVERIARAAGSVVDVPMDTGRQMVLSGVGAGFFPWMQVADLVRAGRLRAIEVAGAEGLDRASVLVRRPDDPPPSPAATAFVSALRARAASLGLLTGAEMPPWTDARDHPAHPDLDAERGGR